MNQYDLITIGAGAAGFASIIKAAELNKKVLLIDNGKLGLGGTCVNVGCVPTKTLLHLADIIYNAKTKFSRLFSKVEIKDPRQAFEETREVVSRLRKTKYEDLIETLDNVDYIRGKASLKPENKVSVNGKTFEGKQILIATGSRTFIPDIKGLDQTGYITHVEAVRLEYLPKSIVIIGGGPVGVEFSQIFHRLGSTVTLLQKQNRILPREDPDLSMFLQSYLNEEGINILNSVNVKEAKKKGEIKEIIFEHRGQIKRVEAEEIFIATGRVANTEGMGLENLGVKLGPRGEVIVDRYLNAKNNIWAAGDVKGHPMFETVAAREGTIAAGNALTSEKVEMDYSIIPHAIFVDPQLASVGLKEKEALEKGFEIETRLVSMDAVPKAHAISDTRGFIKIVAEKKSHRILGVHLLARNASEIIHEATFAIINKMTVDQVAETLHVFPTLTEIIRIGSLDFIKDTSKLPCCV